MEWYDNASSSLEYATLILEEIKTLDTNYNSKKSAIPLAKIKIKNCLENCRSALDFSAYYIWELYCLDFYTAQTKDLEYKKRQICFPLSKNAEVFDKFLQKHFKPMIENHADLICIFREFQSYNNENTLHFQELSNTNKHRTLTTKAVNKRTLIKSALIGTNRFVNCEISNCDVPFVINDTPVDFIDKTDYDHMFDAQIEVEYFFREYDLPVVSTLEKYIQESSKVIDGIYKILS